MHYEKLNAKMEVLAHDSDEFSMIDEYVRNTHGHTHTQYKLCVKEVHFYITKTAF